MKNKVLVLGCLGLLFLGACGKKEKEKKVEEAPVIETFALAKENLSSSLHLPGELVAYQQVDVYAKVPGFIKTMNVDLGTEVSAGQLLATLEAPELHSQVSAAQSRLHSQQAVLTASTATYNRLLETSKTPGTISSNDLDIALARKNADQALLEAAKASVNEVNTMMAYLQIRAPFSGVISARNVNLGAFVGPAGKGSEQPMFTIQEQRRLRLAVSIPENFTSMVRNGSDVKFSVRSSNDTLHAKVKRLAGALDLRLRSEKVEIDVMNPSKKLLPGMIAEVTIPLTKEESTFAVPSSAVLIGSQGNYVQRLNKGKVEWVPINKGREVNGKIEIFGSLSAGDTLVTKASEEFREGSAIK